MPFCRTAQLAASLATLLVAAPPAGAQTFPTADSVLRRIWTLGMDSSRVEPLAQALLDSIGPRLTGTPGQRAANRWALDRYREWGIPARLERYGTWHGWRRGVTHVDLVAPRVRTLEATLLAWSPATRKGGVQGPAVVFPEVADSAAFARWLPQAKGKFVLVSFAQPTCRPDSNWEQYATSESLERMRRERAAAFAAWQERLRRTGLAPHELPRRLERAGALGVVTSNWSQGWGVNKVFSAWTERAPTLDLSCEDYGLVFRLAEREQGPALRVEATAERLGEVPAFNVVAELPGVERPGEYVVLSAHFDSWDGASGATDNGTGTVTMMEAMRILRAAYPRPKRTILVGHWGGEEQGLNGSRAFVQDHPEVVRGLQAAFNQDNGTGRVSTISMQGFTGAGAAFGRWLAQVPPEITRHVSLVIPGTPSAGGSDYASFVCAGAPAFNLTSNSWEYATYTWHTNRDTYDKLVFDDVRNNATLTAMLAYLANEDPEPVARERRLLASVLGDAGDGWPECVSPARSWEESTRYGR